MTDQSSEIKAKKIFKRSLDRQEILNMPSAPKATPPINEAEPEPEPEPSPAEPIQIDPPQTKPRQLVEESLPKASAAVLAESESIESESIEVDIEPSPEDMALLQALEAEILPLDVAQSSATKIAEVQTNSEPGP